MESERNKLILEVATEGFWDWDLVQDRAYLSPRYCEMICYAADETVFDSKFLRQIIHPDDHALVFGVIEEYQLGRRKTSVVAHRLISHDGSIRWVETRARAVAFDNEGQPTRLVGTVVDITERKRFEVALLEGNELFNKLSQQVPGALFHTVITPDGHTSTPYASIQLNDIYEVPPGQITADISAIAARFHPEDRERIFKSIAESAKNVSKWECEYRVLLPRQGLKWLYGVALPEKRSDGTIDLYGIVMDVTARKKIEEDLNHSQQLLSSIIDNAPYAFFVKDVQNDFRLVIWNKTAERIFGVPADTILGRHAHDLWRPEQADAYLANDRATVAARTPLDILEETSSHPEKGTIYLHTRKIPLFNNVGDVSHIVVICEDITEQRILQAEHIKIQKLESLGVLAGGIAHDFNNILTGIVGNISLACRYLDDSSKAARLLKESEKAAYRATDLAQQLLTFAKGGQPITRTASVRHMIETTTTFILSGSNVSSSVTLPGDLLDVIVDEGKMNQVFNNVIINATQAMPGGGAITITAENISLETGNLTLLTPGPYVRISISDTGCGISDENLKKIFDPYFSTKSRGSGLGLASAYSIICKHGGHIRADSTVDVGTTFEILLPASQDKAIAQEQATTAASTYVPTGSSILVMDDEELIRAMTTEMLEELHCHVQTCASGEEAIGYFQRARSQGVPYAAVILDLTIPGGMGGKEVARQLLTLDPHARLIVSSGYSNDPIMANYAAFGFCAALLKPYGIDQLIKSLHAVLTLPKGEPALAMP